MGKGSSGSTTQTTVNKVEPPDYLKGPLQNLAASADSWYRNGGTQYAAPGMSYYRAKFAIDDAAQNAGNYLDPGRRAAIDLANGTYMQGNPLFNGQLFQMDDTAQGKYLGQQNPYLAGVVGAAQRPVTDNFMNAIAPSLASQFSLAGRMGSGSHVAAFDSATSRLGQQLGDISSNIYGNAYESERGRMANASNARLAEMAQAWGEVPRYRAAGAGLLPVLLGSQMNAAKDQFNAALTDRDLEQLRLDLPRQNLASYSGMLSNPAYGSTTTGSQSGTTQQNPNRLQQTAGLGLTGFALGGPVGAAIGIGAGLFG